MLKTANGSVYNVTFWVILIPLCSYKLSCHPGYFPQHFQFIWETLSQLICSSNFSILNVGALLIRIFYCYSGHVNLPNIPLLRVHELLIQKRKNYCFSVCAQNAQRHFPRNRCCVLRKVLWNMSIQPDGCCIELSLGKAVETKQSLEVLSECTNTVKETCVSCVFWIVSG